MTLSVPKTAKAVLIGASNFPKDDTLSPINQAESNIKSFAQVLADTSIIGIDESNIIRMMDVPDNTKIKEELSVAAEEATGAMIVYITGHITTRKGHLYLATPNSSRKKIHINGIALDELLDIISETNAETRILIFDAYYSDVNDEETEGDVVVDALKYYESAYLNTFILSASPASNLVGFKGSSAHTSFTEALLNTLQNGLDKEQEVLSLEDIHEGIKEQMTGQVPVKSTASKADKITFAFNTKFLGFRDLKNTADRFFEDEQFQDALTAYEDASKLFAKNSEVKKRKKFIKRFLDGEKAVDKGNFEKAKDSFLEAQEIFDMKVVSEKINGVLMTIANTLFDKEKYEQARENYKIVASYRPNDSFVKERLEKCDHELRFLDLIDEADKFYFEDEFAEAFTLYDKALQIHPDRKAAKRKEECERLMHKANSIRKQIQQEEANKVSTISDEAKSKLEKELRAKIEKEFQLSFDSKKIKLTTDLTQQVKTQEKANFNKQLWSNISLANSLDVYEFFIQYYPKSAYIGEAKKKLDALNQIVSKQKAVQQEKAETPVAKEKAEIPAKGVAEKREDSSKKHKPFIKEEKGRSHISEAKPYNILEELEAQFNNTSTTKSTVTEKSNPTVEEKKEDKSPEELINKVVQEKKPEVKPITDQVKETPIPKKEEKQPVETVAKKEEPQPKKEEKPVEEAPKTVTEEELWQKAVESNSVEGYRHYVDNTKESEHLVDAYYQINKLSKMADAGVLETESKTEHKNGQSKPVVKEEKTATHTYTTTEVSTTPVEKPVNSKPEEKSNTTNESDENQLWQKANEANTVNAYYEYVANSKEKKYLEEAKQRIASLKENAKESEKGDWEAAEASNTIDGYKSYIKKYPLGHYYAKAMFRISELEAQL